MNDVNEIGMREKIRNENDVNERKRQTLGKDN